MVSPSCIVQSEHAQLHLYSVRTRYAYICIFDTVVILSLKLPHHSGHPATIFSQFSPQLNLLSSKYETWWLHSSSGAFELKYPPFLKFTT